MKTRGDIVRRREKVLLMCQRGLPLVRAWSACTRPRCLVRERNGEAFFFPRSFRAVSWVPVSQAGGKVAKRRALCFSAALWAFAFRPLLGCLIGFASVLFVFSLGRGPGHRDPS